MESPFGIVVLRDTKPAEGETLIAQGVPTVGGGDASEENEPEPPPAFEYLG